MACFTVKPPVETRQKKERGFYRDYGVLAIGSLVRRSMSLRRALVVGRVSVLLQWLDTVAAFGAVLSHRVMPWNQYLFHAMYQHRQRVTQQCQHDQHGEEPWHIQ